MELRWLQDFLMVPRPAISRAPPSDETRRRPRFSRRIKSLEAWLGFDLIDRSVYPTQLTPQGERFREHAGELLKQMLDTRDELGASRCVLKSTSGSPCRSRWPRRGCRSGGRPGPPSAG
jgi:hypothetical protein